MQEEQFWWAGHPSSCLISCLLSPHTPPAERQEWTQESQPRVQGAGGSTLASLGHRLEAKNVSLLHLGKFPYHILFELN